MKKDTIVGKVKDLDGWFAKDDTKGDLGIKVNLGIGNN